MFEGEKDAAHLLRFVGLCNRSDGDTTDAVVAESMSVIRISAVVYV